jgi:hypothetical protein
LLATLVVYRAVRRNLDPQNPTALQQYRYVQSLELVRFYLCAVVLALALSVLLAGLFGLALDLPAVLFIALAGSGIGCAAVRGASPARLCLAPCFERPLPKRQPFQGGAFLFDNLEVLDERADQAGVRRLSSFGLRNGWRLQERSAWHDPGELLQTVLGLERSVGQDCQGLTNRGALLEELAWLAVSLRAARAQGIKAGLVWRVGWGGEAAVTPPGSLARPPRGAESWELPR